MLQYAYIVLCGEDKSISGEAYTTYEKAAKFVNNRAHSPIQVDCWHWIDSKNYRYEIKELNLR